MPASATMRRLRDNADDLEHQVGADVAGSDHRDRDTHDSSITNTARTSPSASTRARYTPGAVTGTTGPSAPDRTMCPARNGCPRLTSSPASQVTATTGEPMHAAPAPVDTGTPPCSITTPTPVRSTLSTWVGRGAEDERARGRVVGDRVRDPDVPSRDPRVDDLDGRQHESRGTQHIRDRRRLGQILTEHERDLRFDARLDEPGERDRLAVRVGHVVRQHAEIRLEHAELTLHGRRRQSDLVPHDPALDVERLDGIGRVDVVQQITYGRARHPGPRRLGEPGPGCRYRVGHCVGHSGTPHSWTQTLVGWR